MQLNDQFKRISKLTVSNANLLKLSEQAPESAASISFVKSCFGIVQYSFFRRGGTIAFLKLDGTELVGNEQLISASFRIVVGTMSNWHVEEFQGEINVHIIRKYSTLVSNSLKQKNVLLICFDKGWSAKWHTYLLGFRNQFKGPCPNQQHWSTANYSTSSNAFVTTGW